MAVIIWIVFGQTRQFDFVNYDDELYVYENPAVSHGLTSPGISSAFTAQGLDNWVPLTMLSHALDCQFYGLQAGNHHLTNVMLHTIAATLLFLVLTRMTAALWRSAFVAAAFAIHPLGVESVAWISERKDVLSGVFFMLTLWMYVDYVRRPSPVRYLMALFFAALGLMSKPMLVTLPFVLLLLDYWPLKRFTTSVLTRLIVEKIPFLLLSIAASVITMLMQQRFNAVKSLASVPLPLRVENAFVSYARYLGKMVCPRDLAVFYPYPDHWPLFVTLLSVAVVVALSIAVIVGRKQYPFILTGWFWFAGMLVPVIGLVQVGSQAMADRYMYLPQIGVYLALAWLVAELFIKLRCPPWVLGSLSAVILAVLTYCARTQTAYWANSEALWSHTLACTSGNDVASSNLGILLYKKGDVDGAINDFREAATFAPDNASYHGNLATALLQARRVDEAITEYREAARLIPGDAGYHTDLGDALYDNRQFDDAIVEYKAALKLDPGNKTIQNVLIRAALAKTLSGHVSTTTPTNAPGQ